MICNLKDSKLATVTEHALGKVLSFENSSWDYIYECRKRPVLKEVYQQILIYHNRDNYNSTGNNVVKGKVDIDILNSKLRYVSNTVNKYINSNSNSKEYSNTSNDNPFIHDQ